MSHAIGIDFGTTKTMVSYLNPATGRPELVRLGRDRDSVPTTVHVDESGEFLFGEDADDLIETDPEGYCRAFKLHLGEEEPVLPKALQTAEALAAKFLAYVKTECEQSVFHGESVDEATLTIPVAFSPARKSSLERAARSAGFSKVTFLPEPEAAGTAFLRDNPTDKFSRALVLDWGGGTLDIAVIARDDDGKLHADRRCAGGRDDIGGEEMDRALLGQLDALWSQQFGVNLLDAGENEPKLLREAEKTKIFLSRKDSTAFRRGPKKIDITREEFNRMVEPLVQEAAELVRDALSKNEAKGQAAPDAILLIGGTSLIPVVRETMEREFPGIRVLSWHHSHEAVALGATRLAGSAPEKRESRSKDARMVTDRNAAFPIPAPSVTTMDMQHLEATLSMAENWRQAQGNLSGIEKAWADEIAKGAEAGHPRAAGLLADIFHTGCQGYQKNLQTSFKWASKAAELGDAVGQSSLAYYYFVPAEENGAERDSPVRQDLHKALEWGEKAYATKPDIENTVCLMLILGDQDQPDKQRIQSLGNKLLKNVQNKTPEQCSLQERALLGGACLMLANIADENIGLAEGDENAQQKYCEKELKYLEKGAEFGNESCAEQLKLLEEKLEENTQSGEETSVEENNSWGVGTGAAVGAAMGTVIPGIGTVLGAGIGAAVGGFKKWINGDWD